MPWSRTASAALPPACRIISPSRSIPTCSPRSWRRQSVPRRWRAPRPRSSAPAQGRRGRRRGRCCPIGCPVSISRRRWRSAAATPGASAIPWRNSAAITARPRATYAACAMPADRPRRRGWRTDCAASPPISECTISPPLPRRWPARSRRARRSTAMRASMRRGPWVLGIRGRLLLAFLVISAFVVLAALAAVQALLQVSSLVGEITERRTPAIITSLSMSREVERMLGATQELAVVESQPLFEQKVHALALAADDLDRLVARLQEVQQEPVGELSQLVERMRVNVVDLEAKVRDRLSVAERKSEGLAALLRTDLLFQAAMMAQIRPLVSEAERIGATMAAAGSAGPISGEEITHLIQLDAAQTLEVTFSRAHDLLLIGVSSPSEEDLQLKRITVRRTIDELDRAVMEVPLDFARAVQISARLRHGAESNDGVLALRAAELADLKAAEALQAQNAAISQQLVTKVDGLVQAHALRVQESMEETARVRRESMLRLILVTAGTLGCSGLIVWLYVNRHIAARLAAVGDSLLALASGQLGVKLPKPQADEIGLMASALEVFRETALQAQEREALLNEARDRSERAREA